MILRKTILCILPMTYTKSVFFTVAKMHILQYEDFFKQYFPINIEFKKLMHLNRPSLFITFIFKKEESIKNIWGLPFVFSLDYSDRVKITKYKKLKLF